MCNTLTCKDSGSFLCGRHMGADFMLWHFSLPCAWHNFQKSFIIAIVSKEAATFLNNVYDCTVYGCFTLSDTKYSGDSLERSYPDEMYRNNKSPFYGGLCSRLLLGRERLPGNQQRFQEVTEISKVWKC